MSETRWDTVQTEESRLGWLVRKLREHRAGRALYTHMNEIVPKPALPLVLRFMFDKKGK